jgi:hypothetical protein
MLIIALPDDSAPALAATSVTIRAPGRRINRTSLAPLLSSAVGCLSGRAASRGRGTAAESSPGASS